MSMKFRASRGTATVLPLSALLVLGLGCGPTASAPEAPPKNTDCVPVDKVVAVTASSSKVDVDIEAALIKTGGSIGWSIKGLPAGYSLEIDFHAQGTRKGPFQATAELIRARAKEKSNVVSLGDRYTVTGAVAGETVLVTSFPAAYSGVWKYAVTVRDAGGAVAAAIDPMIVVK